MPLIITILFLIRNYIKDENFPSSMFHVLDLLFNSNDLLCVILRLSPCEPSYQGTPAERVIEMLLFSYESEVKEMGTNIKKENEFVIERKILYFCPSFILLIGKNSKC